MKIKEVSLGTTVAVQFGEKKYQEKEGDSDQDGYVYCAIYNIKYIYIYKIYIYI